MATDVTIPESIVMGGVEALRHDNDGIAPRTVEDDVMSVLDGVPDGWVKADGRWVNLGDVEVDHDTLTLWWGNRKAGVHLVLDEERKPRSIGWKDYWR